MPEEQCPDRRIKSKLKLRMATCHKASLRIVEPRGDGPDRGARLFISCPASIDPASEITRRIMGYSVRLWFNC
jgi:hypothetical protein